MQLNKPLHDDRIAGMDARLMASLQGHFQSVSKNLKL